ncbi:MAG: recombinase family protein [Oscillospiraceae bacterium]|nr:recombinase family protein [Oscillospiraceae bacterium]
MVDPLDKHHYVIDPETAPIVERIFKMSADGISPYLIAKELTLEKIPTPLETKNGTYTGIEWSRSNVHKMLKDKVYIGCMVYGRQIKPSFKSKKTVLTDESDWIIIPDRHEALIKTDLFELVQKRVGVKKRKSSTQNENVFVGIAKCFDCGSNFTLAKNNASGIAYLSCYHHRNFSKTKKCTMHYINYKFLCELVLKAIQKNITVVALNEQRMEDFIRESLSNSELQNNKSEDALLAKLTRRKSELDSLIEWLFEETVLGNLSSERLYDMSEKYESESAEVVSRIGKIKATLAEKADVETNYRRFFEVMMKYKGAEDLSATMVNELIERIVIHENEGGKRATRYQQIDIHYRFIDEGLKSLDN